MNFGHHGGNSSAEIVPPACEEAALNLHPLVVDLDGTLIRTDMLHECALRTLRDKPLDILRFHGCLLQGKAVLKRHLAERLDLDPGNLPYNQELLDWLKQQHAQGRKLILCTAADSSIATAISEHLNIFDGVMASDGATNLSGKNKAEALEQRFGRGGFDYAGNSPADLEVWQRARRAIVVNATAEVTKKAGAYCRVERVFSSSTSGLAVWRSVLRVRQWLKNLLLLCPMLASHQIADPATWLSAIIAFFSFSFCASAGYVVNDLLDLESDRQHPRKSKRPFASGQSPAWMGVVLVPLLLLGSMVLARQVGDTFLRWLVFYFILSCAYSRGLKRLVMIDCLILAMFYTVRIIAGAAATETKLGFWLLAISVFLFFSLALVKRYAELQRMLQETKQKTHGRGYYSSDAPLVQMMGIASGYCAVLVLALYINRPRVVQLYANIEFVWGAVPVLLFWISWVWLKAHRGEMHDDPLIFATREKASLLAGVFFVMFLLLGVADLPW